MTSMLHTIHNHPDINECALGTAGCNANATCADTEGSFTCLCLQGYEGDGESCQSKK